MAPKLRFAGRVRSYERYLMERDDSDDESDGESDYGDDDRSTTTSPPPTLSSPSRDAVASDAAADPRASLNRVSEEGTHVGQRIGTVFGVVAGITLLLIAAYLFRRHRRARKMKAATLPVAAPATRDLPPPDTRTGSQILDELIATAYAQENGGAVSIADEKKRPGSTSSSGDTAEGVSFPYHTATIRASVASWLRRHHPLQLNSLSRWSATTTSSSVPTTPAAFSSRVTSAVPPVPPIPAMPPPVRQSSRFKSVWSDTTVDTETDPSRHASVMTVMVGMQGVQGQSGDRGSRV